MGRTAQIDVERASDGAFDVVVDEFTSARDYRVTLSKEYFERFAKGRTEEVFIRDAFRFLLMREPKESIRSAFPVEDIKNYFPEFEEEI